jgi:toxin ParE1/3/4
VARARFSPEAIADLQRIQELIAQGDLRQALLFVRALRDTCHRIAATPYMGRARSDLRPGLRSSPHGAYLILYRVAIPRVEIVRILHGSRDLRRLV